MAANKPVKLTPSGRWDKYSLAAGPLSPASIRPLPERYIAKGVFRVWM
jgi:hypothetical protein